MKLWIAIAGTALIAGGVAWFLKVWVILATDGRVAYTGAAATFFDLGLVLLLVGSTGVGLRLAMNLETSMRVVLAVVSPLVFGALFAVFGGIGYIILVIGRAIIGVAVPGYLLEEGGIFVSAVVGLVVGLWLVVGVTLGALRVVRMALREARSQSPDRGCGKSSRPTSELPKSLFQGLIHRTLGIFQLANFRELWKGEVRRIWLIGSPLVLLHKSAGARRNGSARTHKRRCVRHTGQHTGHPYPANRGLAEETD